MQYGADCEPHITRLDVFTGKDQGKNVSGRKFKIGTRGKKEFTDKSKEGRNAGIVDSVSGKKNCEAEGSNICHASYSELDLHISRRK